ncbi:MAG: crossover junction endodeoxyribonuclease RuvC [Patescibacteria group bacterium]
MRILGIDPGFERLGLAILEKRKGETQERVIFSECFKTTAQLEFPDRLNLIGAEIREKIKKYKPEILAIETLFFASNQKTVMRVAETRGVIIYEATLAGLMIFEISPLQVKMSVTGYGGADKKQILKMVKMLIQVDDEKTSDDELDAIAIALTAFTHKRI